MPETKDPWRVTAGADEPAGAVAARVVASRLRAIHPLLREAARGGREPIHALRVATRRAQAALDVFADLLGARRSKRVAKRLRRMRRAAGEARDLDVLVERLRGERHDARGLAGRALGGLEEERRDARRPLSKLAERCPRRRWRRRTRALVATIGGLRARERFDRFAARRLAEIHARFAEATASLAERPRHEAAAVHRLRIAAKKTRYATEILAVHAPARWRRLWLDRLARFQSVAGDSTDRVRAGERLRRLERRARGRGTRTQWGELARREEAAASRARAAVLRMLPALARLPSVPRPTGASPRPRRAAGRS